MSDRALLLETDRYFIECVNKQYHPGLWEMMFHLYEMRVLEVEPKLPSRFLRWLNRPATYVDGVEINKKIIDRALKAPVSFPASKRPKICLERFELLKIRMHDVNLWRGDPPPGKMPLPIMMMPPG